MGVFSVTGGTSAEGSCLLAQPASTAPDDIDSAKINDNIKLENLFDFFMIASLHAF